MEASFNPQRGEFLSDLSLENLSKYFPSGDNFNIGEIFDRSERGIALFGLKKVFSSHKDFLGSLDSEDIELLRIEVSSKILDEAKESASSHETLLALSEILSFLIPDLSKRESLSYKEEDLSQKVYDSFLDCLQNLRNKKNVFDSFNSLNPVFTKNQLNSEAFLENIKNVIVNLTNLEELGALINHPLLRFIKKKLILDTEVDEKIKDYLYNEFDRYDSSKNLVQLATSFDDKYLAYIRSKDFLEKMEIGVKNLLKESIYRDNESKYFLARLNKYLSVVNGNTKLRDRAYKNLFNKDRIKAKVQELIEKSERLNILDKFHLAEVFGLSVDPSSKMIRTVTNKIGDLIVADDIDELNISLLAIKSRYQSMLPSKDFLPTINRIKDFIQNELSCLAEYVGDTEKEDRLLYKLEKIAFVTALISSAKKEGFLEECLALDDEVGVNEEEKEKFKNLFRDCFEIAKRDVANLFSSRSLGVNFSGDDSLKSVLVIKTIKDKFNIERFPMSETDFLGLISLLKSSKLTRLTNFDSIKSSQQLTNLHFYFISCRFLFNMSEKKYLSLIGDLSEKIRIQRKKTEISKNEEDTDFLSHSIESAVLWRDVSKSSILVKLALSHEISLEHSYRSKLKLNRTSIIASIELGDSDLFLEGLRDFSSHLQARDKNISSNEGQAFLPKELEVLNYIFTYGLRFINSVTKPLFSSLLDVYDKFYEDSFEFSFSIRDDNENEKYNLALKTISLAKNVFNLFTFTSKESESFKSYMFSIYSRKEFNLFPVFEIIFENALDSLEKGSSINNSLLDILEVLESYIEEARHDEKDNVKLNNFTVHALKIEEFKSRLM